MIFKYLLSCVVVSAGAISQPGGKSLKNSVVGYDDDGMDVEGVDVDGEELGKLVGEVGFDVGQLEGQDGFHVGTLVGLHVGIFVVGIDVGIDEDGSAEG